MRVLIESRKLTIELASSKKPVADQPGANTFATETAFCNPNTSRLYKECDFDSANEQYSATGLDTSISRHTQFPRRKSIHKRIGRFFLRVSKMCSDGQYSAFAHQYSNAAFELPAGGSPADGTKSFYEMPGSFPRVELEQPMTEEPPVQCPFNPSTCPSAAPDHLRNHYKSNENAMLRRHAPLSIANLPQLPRLEVPQSQHRVPKLISDHSPLTPSPVSPYTPAAQASNTHIHDSGSQMYFDALSPYRSPSQGQVFAHYGSWSNQTQLSSTTPSTATSYGSSHATTPLSAYASSASSPFQSWPQLPLRQMPPTYTQADTPLNYNPRMNDPSAVGTISWTGEGYLKPCDYSEFLAESQVPGSSFDYPAITSYNASPQAQSCYEERNKDCTPQPQPKSCQFSAIYDAPPAYNPTPTDPHPATLNPPQRHPPSVCQQCGKVFTGKYGPGNCKRHVQQTHETVLDRMKNMCKVCRKTYNRADALRKHAWKKHRLEQFRPNKRRKDD